MSARMILGVVLAGVLAAGEASAQGAPQPTQGRRAAPAGQGAGVTGRGRGAAAAPPVRRLPDGKPDLSGFYDSVHRGANYGIEEHAGSTLTPPGQGIVVDPPDGKLPMQEWAKEELKSRQTPARGYDDPTAHCVMDAGV